MFYSRFPAVDNLTPAAYEPDRGSIYPHVKNGGIFLCPADGHSKSGNSYAINGCATNRAASVASGLSLTQFDNPSDTIFFTEEADVDGDEVNGGSDDGYFQFPGNPLAARHLLFSNMSFIDGHAKSVKPSTAIARGYPFGNPSLSSCP